MKHPLHIFPAARPRLAARQQAGTRHIVTPHPARHNSTRTATDIRMQPRVRHLSGLRRWVAALCCTAVLAGCATPTQNGAAADAATAPSEARPVRVRLLFAGDVMAHTPQLTAARTADGQYDFRPVFAYLKPHFAEADAVIVNLETTLSPEPPFSGYPCFRTPASMADALRDAGVDMAVLANNHCCDAGERGIRRTARELERCGIRHTGVFADSIDFVARNPLLFEQRGIRFALLNYTYSTNGNPVPKGVIVNRIDSALMVRDLERVRRDSVDCTIVCIHWGVEYERRENGSQRHLADLLRRHGADIIIGSHPHVVQPFRADSLHAVFYSLGNFVSNQRWRYSDGGLMAEVTATRRPSGRMSYTARPVPVWVLHPGYRIVPPEVGDTLPMAPAVRAQYERFMEDTRRTLGE